MPRGKYVNHKGRSRHFTSPDELERERKKELEKKWRKKKEGDEEGESSDEEESDKEVAEGAAGAAAKKADDESGSEESESESEDDESKKKKGVEGLIEIENPNRIVKKVKKPAAKVEDDVPKEGNPNRASSSSVKPELSRREREELEKQRARAHYQKLHAEGKTEEARADLARLALIRKQREEAAKKREDDKKAKDAASAAKQEQTNKALGKKT